MATSFASIHTPAKAGAKILFPAVIFAGSFLLFLMQPMIARMALPRLGGAPAVWNSAMLVYQALLLMGYGYAHLLGRFGARTQGAIHGALLLLAAAWLPIGLTDQAMPTDASPTVWVPWLLFTSIGPLFLVLSAQAPLLQRWFASVDSEANPYSLYVASNLGSFGGLIAYPLLVEPLMPLASQSNTWSVAYLIAFAAIGVIALRLPASATIATAQTNESPAPSLRIRLQWIALAAVPSGLILATTTHLTTDIIAMPLIWVVPLGLYLLSFTIAFRDKSRIAGAISWAFPLILLVPGVMAAGGKFFPLWAAILADLTLLIGAAVALHHRMYLLRPDKAHLTTFYLCMSIGGVTGGAFCALLAPALFDWMYEFPLLVLAAALLMPMRTGLPVLSWRQRRSVLLGAMLLSMYAGGILGYSAPPLAMKVVALVIIAMLARIALAHRFLFTACLASLLLGLGCWMNILISLNGEVRLRSYFGIYTVGASPEVHVLTHGTTTHGIQLQKNGMQTYPTAYFAPKSGVGIAMRAAPILFGEHARIAVIGLGAGTLACYAQSEENWRFYEIDPAVVKIARDPKKFSFLQRCLPNTDIVLGDARLTIAREQPSSRDLLAVDAFSSDSIPMHLLTREAIDSYAKMLQPKGLLLFHISNRYVDLKPVLAAAAYERGWKVIIRDYQPDPADISYRSAHSIWVAMSPSSQTIQGLVAAGPAEAWTPLAPRLGFAAWTDDYGSILPLLHKP